MQVNEIYIIILLVILIFKMGIYNSIREIFYEYKRTNPKDRSGLLPLTILNFVSNELGAFIILDKRGNKIEFENLNHKIGHRWFLNIFWSVWFLVDIRDNFDFFTSFIWA